MSRFLVALAVTFMLLGACTVSTFQYAGSAYADGGD